MDVHAKTRLDHASIFESLSQIITDDPATMRPLFDRILVRDVPDEEFSPGGIVLTAAPSLGGLGKSGRIRIGDVIAVGKGDPYKNWVEKGVVKKRAYPCPLCGGGDDPHIPRCRRCGISEIYGFTGDQCKHDYDDKWCPRCEGRRYSHVDLIVKVGDRVVYDRRKEAEVFFNGDRYCMMHEYQAVYGVILSKPRMVVVPFEQCKTKIQQLFGGYMTADEQFFPIYDRVVIKPLEEIQTGMIMRPGTAKQPPFRRGIVRAVGQGSRRFDGQLQPLSVKPGDVVMFRAEGGGGAARAEEITLFGEGLMIMREKLIAAVIE